MPLRECLGIQDQLLASGGHRDVGDLIARGGGHPVAAGVIQAFGRPGVIPIAAAVGVGDVTRHREVRLLRARLEFAIDGLSEAPKIRSLLVGVGVLRLQVRDQFRIGLVGHPVIRIEDRVTMDGARVRALRRVRGGELGFGHAFQRSRGLRDRRAVYHDGLSRSPIWVRPQAVEEWLCADH